MWQDVVNGLFEFCAGAMVWINVAAIRRDKQIRGISFIPVILFTAWGIWNLWFYRSLGLWVSWLGGIMVVLANSVWLYYVWKYRKLNDAPAVS
jgi:hypothetical protein